MLIMMTKHGLGQQPVSIVIHNISDKSFNMLNSTSLALHYTKIDELGFVKAVPSLATRHGDGVFKYYFITKYLLLKCSREDNHS